MNLWNRLLVKLGLRFTAPLKAPKAKRTPFVSCPICSGDRGVDFILETGHMCPMCDGTGHIPEWKHNKLVNNMIGETINE